MDRKMPEFIYKGSKTKEISFPLGGICTGCLGLSASCPLVNKVRNINTYQNVIAVNTIGNVAVVNLN